MEKRHNLISWSQGVLFLSQERFLSIKLLTQSVSNLVWSSDLGFPGVLLAPCPEDVSLVLSVMTNTAQFESVEEREAKRE